jgi:hypothetical protein
MTTEAFQSQVIMLLVRGVKQATQSVEAKSRCGLTLRCQKVKLSQPEFQGAAQEQMGTAIRYIRKLASLNHISQ